MEEQSDQPAEHCRNRSDPWTHPGYPVRTHRVHHHSDRNIIGGAMHDYFSGMICLRDGGTQMPDMIRKYSNKGIYTFYQIFCSLLLLLVGAVFIYTPGDIAATQVFNFDGKATSVSTWVIYGVIFAYYLIATVFPIDKIIGRIYDLRRDPSVLSSRSVHRTLCSRLSADRDLGGLERRTCGIRRLLQRESLYPDLLHHRGMRYPFRIPLHTDSDYFPYDEEREGRTHNIL